MKDSKTIHYHEILETIEIPKVNEELAPYLAYENQGEYTIDDYYNLPDDYQVELIDGIIYNMSSPSTIHQIIISKLWKKFDNYIDSQSGNCIAMFSPMDVQLDCDDKTILQPDIFILCNRDKLKHNVVYGAPDLVVEVLSPSTQNKDIKIKTVKYRKARVKEYWMINPQTKQICVHIFIPNIETTLYSFEDKIPVGVWDGKCVVDFKEIYDYVKFLNEQN